MRKLLLRGYLVRILVRNEKLLDEMLPSRVEVLVGDVTDPKSCQEAMHEVDKVRANLAGVTQWVTRGTGLKVVFAAGSRLLDAESYESVFNVGLRNMLHAFTVKMTFSIIKREV